MFAVFLISEQSSVLPFSLCFGVGLPTFCSVKQHKERCLARYAVCWKTIMILFTASLLPLHPLRRLIYLPCCRQCIMSVTVTCPSPSRPRTCHVFSLITALWCSDLLDEIESPHLHTESPWMFIDNVFYCLLYCVTSHYLHEIYFFINFMSSARAGDIFYCL